MREFQLLNHIYQSNHTLDAQRITIPPGDDMGMIELNENSSLLAAVDQVIEDVHFRREQTSLQLIGRKAVTRSLSDIAAMAAQPIASLCAVVLPNDMTEQDCQTLFDAVRNAATEFHCPLIGGDIAVHRSEKAPLVCSVTVLATPLSPQHPPIRRDGAQPGDVLYVTGKLGGSFRDPHTGHHLTFTPRIELAKKLYHAIGLRLHAMIDLSDGLGRDASHIASASQCDIEIVAEEIPRNSNCTWQQAASDGEDYELCFAATGDIPNEIDNIPITAVGNITNQSNKTASKITFIDNNTKVDGTQLGWEH